MTQKRVLLFKAVLKSFGKLGPSLKRSIATLMPFPPLPPFTVQVHAPQHKLSRIIEDMIQFEILLHLCYPCRWVRTVKFMHIQLGRSLTGWWVGVPDVRRVARLTLIVFIAIIHLLMGLLLSLRD